MASPYRIAKLAAPAVSSSALHGSAAATARSRHAASAVFRSGTSFGFTASPFSTSTAAYKSSTFARSPLVRLTPSTLLSGNAPWQQQQSKRHRQPPLKLAGSFGSSVRHLSLFSRSSPDSHYQVKEAAAQAVQAKDQLTEKAEDAVESIKESASSASEQVRQASSEAADSFVSAAHNTTAEPLGASGSLSDVAAQVDPTSASTLAETVGASATLGPQAGELSSLGLAHWSSPPGWITNLLDFIGMHTGLPWWGTIMVTTVILRLLVAPVNIWGQKNAIRLGNVQPEMKRLMDDVKHHKAAGDLRGAQESITAVQKLMRDHNVNPFKNLVPVAVQLPLMFSFFLALERIAKSGSETFAHGGPFWTLDLTSPDPTYVLPLVSTVATLAVAELGFKLGTASGSQDQTQARTIQWVFRALMPVIGWFATTFPSGVLVYWATTNIWSLFQAVVLQIPVVRRLANFPQRVQHPPNPYEPKKASLVDRFREARTASRNPEIASASNAGKMEALREIMGDKRGEAGSVARREYEGAVPPAGAAAKTRNTRIAKARARRAA